MNSNKFIFKRYYHDCISSNGQKLYEVTVSILLWSFSSNYVLFQLIHLKGIFYYYFVSPILLAESVIYFLIQLNMFQLCQKITFRSIFGCYELHWNLFWYCIATFFRYFRLCNVFADNSCFKFHVDGFQLSQITVVIIIVGFIVDATTSLNKLKCHFLFFMDGFYCQSALMKTHGLLPNLASCVVVDDERFSDW